MQGQYYHVHMILARLLLSWPIMGRKLGIEGQLMEAKDIWK